MSEKDNAKQDGWVKKYLPFIIYGGLALIGGSLFICCVAIKSAEEMAKIEHRTLPAVPVKLSTDSVPSFENMKNDTVIYVSDYKARVAIVDSLYSDMYRLSERYREESAQLVDRTGAWMGFWIALICMLTGLFAFFQYNSMRNEIHELKECENELRGRIGEKEVELKEKIKTYEEKIGQIDGTIEQRVKAKTEDLDRKSIEFESKLKRMEHASKVSAISQCVMILPDAEMSNDMERSKDLICSFHKLLVDNFDAYYHELKKDKEETIDMSQIKVVLSMVRNSISRVQSVSTNPSNAIALFEASKKVNECIEECLTGEINKYNILEELESICKKLLAVSAKLGNTANV